MAHDTTCLVTGGAGFVGSHLCDRLLQNGHTVIAWDNLQTGAAANLAHLIAHPNFSFVAHDISEARRVPDAVTQIYNLACPASPVHYGREPIKTLKTSVWGAMHLLEQAEALSARILQASTSEVYGDPQLHPQPETYWGHVNSFGPRACYDEGKRAAETLFYDFHHSRGVDVRVARIFNTYGPRMAPDDGRVVSNLVVQALAKAPLTIYGAGQQTRSFCYIDDLIAGLMALMNAESAGAEPINLGNPAEVTMLQLAEEIIRQTKSPSAIVHAPLPQDDPKQRCPDIQRAWARLGWRPTTALAAGLAQTIAYFRARLPVPQTRPSVELAQTMVVAGSKLMR